ncbi:MAG: alginate export family protein [Candidatus Omnitrophota bacterium]|jgi:predicted porin
MSKRLIAVLALALVAGLAFSPAYAEVQNVKVSGDIIASGVARNSFNLTNGSAGDKNNIKQSFIMSQLRVRIDADLTDNVMATVRLINERVWNGQYDNSSSGNSDIDLDLAYVTLKEFLYSPLTLTIGRQEIKFGNGLIIGNAGGVNDVANIPNDLSERKSFDALRATLNYDPLVVDLIYAKVKETDTSRKNTINLTGINATYTLNSKVNVSAYFFNKRDNNDGTTSGSKGKADQVNTIGALISSSPIENLTASVEAAMQFGKNDNGTDASRHDAWALQAMADYTFAKVKMTPKIGASYTYLSGGETSNSRNEGWDSMFYDQALNNITYALLPFSNMSVINLRASAKPVEDVTLSANYGYYDRAKSDSSSTLTSPASYDGSSSHSYLSNVPLSGKSHLGDALDITAIYDYTEDVQLGLTGGLFIPGKAFANERRNATQIIGSMKVTF